jgi:hypothetical protein
MFKIAYIFSLVCLLNISGLKAQDTDKVFTEIVNLEENTKKEILDFINQVKDQNMKDKLTASLENVYKLFEIFITQVKSITEDITDPKELTKEKLKLAFAFDKLLEKRFDGVDEKIKTAKALDQYRLRWFERVVYVFLRAKIQAFNYYIVSQDNPSDSRLTSYQKKFESYLSDLLTFTYRNRELYKENSVFIKKTFILEDSIGTYSAGDMQSIVVGDLDLLFEFLKGKFNDYQGVYVKTATFKKTEVESIKSQGLLLYMSYQPVDKTVKVKDIRTIEVAVTGDNLEDIVTFTLNQASNIVSSRVASDKSIVKLNTDEIDYKKFTEESINASNVIILKAELLYKKEVKGEKKEGEKKEEEKKEDEENNPNKKKTFEVGIRLKVGLKVK